MYNNTIKNVIFSMKITYKLVYAYIIYSILNASSDFTIHDHVLIKYCYSNRLKTMTMEASLTSQPKLKSMQIWLNSQRSFSVFTLKNSERNFASGSCRVITL